MEIKEEFPMHHFEIREKKPSKIVSGWTHEEMVGFRCPQCHATQPPLDHGEESSCGACGLQFHLAGNCLTCVRT